MPKRKKSVDDLLWDEFNFLQPEERPRYGTPELDKWLEEFQNRHWLVVARMKKPFSQHAMYILQYSIPGYQA